MRAAVVSEFGGPEVLRITEVAVPEPKPDEVLIEHRAIGVNFVDLQHRQGAPYPVTLPLVPGIEAAGVVAKAGSAVAELRVGDHVAYGGPMAGVYAELAAVPADRVIPLPADVPFETAAAVTLQGMTAHYLSHDAYPIRAGDRVMIHAASGGVGGLLLAYAKSLGAMVVGTTSDPDKLALIRARGADHALLVTDADLVAKVRELTGGCHAVYDSLGGPFFEPGLRTLRHRGAMVVYGLAAGRVPPLDVNALSGNFGGESKGSLQVAWTSLGDFTHTRAELLARAGSVYADAASGVIPVRIAERFPLAEAAGAHRRFGSLSAAGKVLLLP
jgi:NADPH:quinone reductase